MGCDVYWHQINELNKAMKTMLKYGIPEMSDAFQQLKSIRYDLLGKMGIKIPRTITHLTRIGGLSPGVIALWHDVEEGWMSEARTKPEALPVYKIVSDDVAMAILKHDISDELEKYLMAPDPYLGE